MHSRWGKTGLAFLLAGSLWAGAFSGSPAASAAQTATGGAIPIVLDGFPLPFDSAPRIDKGVTLVPFRTIAEALGIVVEWNAAAKTIHATGTNVSGQKTDVLLTVGRKTAQVNGAAVTLDAAPVVQASRILIPLAFFGRSFGAQVAWNAQAHSVEIRSPQKKMRLLGFYAISSYDQIGRVAALNSVAFGWSRIGLDGKFTLAGDEYKWPKPAGEVTPESIVQATNSQPADSYLVVYSVDGHGELTNMLSNSALADDSIEQIVSVAKDKGFGGVMLDYEGLGLKDDPATARKLLNDYVGKLSKKLKEGGLKLGLALQPPNGAFKGYDYGTLGKLADEIVLMAYEYHADKTPEPMDRVNEAVELSLKAGIAKSKLLLGVNMDHENEASIGDKLGLAKRYGLSGVSFWRLGILTPAEVKAIDASVVKD
ncbi:stalk domain-containing protein [Cohnella zeiphila]|uniref:stalk domain-containing protein n=1 Tax=Cohnella zeiphila TaxID=2761120 RepID=UPI001EE21388|nr:stalk domain-containing protein [Cohnella zeiphila]